MCIIPYATQMGEISFCAYNTGVGWRQIVEKIHQTATVSDWNRSQGRHAVYANPNKEVPLPLYPTPVALKVSENGPLTRTASPASGRRSPTRATKHDGPSRAELKLRRGLGRSSSNRQASGTTCAF
jgi:hypothetical protein